MSTSKNTNEPDGTVEIDLRNPAIAGVLTWLIPGLGHLYQGRFAKSIIFFVCIFGTYCFGLSLAGGHAVYADMSTVPTSRFQKYFILCQSGVGAPSILAFAQRRIIRSGGNPILGGLMAPPTEGDDYTPGYEWTERGTLAQWHYHYHRLFEISTVYVTVASFLNILAIYDVLAGPVVAEPDDKEDEKEKAKKEDDSGGEPPKGD
ncbi:MAG: hypothetical protein ACI9G1_000017 [Pirellulaceae bacterium]|jgi:hypothetical protein